MPTQKVTCSEDKAVVVRVYVEKPRKKGVSANHHHHHYHIHRRFSREVAHGHDSRGYDRRGELLRYSQRLRASARGAPSTPLLSKQSSNGNRQPAQIVSSKRKPKYAGSPACCGSWKLLIPSFLRSLTIGAKSKQRKKKQMHSGLSGHQITNIIKKLEVNRKRIIAKVFSTTPKRY